MNATGYICMIVDGSYPKDIRVRKEAEALTESGKKVLVVCPKYASQKKEETINGVLVYRIGSNYTRIQKGIYDSIESVLNIHLFFYFHLKKIFKKYSIDFLHVHDLPLASTGYLFKKEVKISIFLDLHENYPEALKTWFLWRTNPFIKLKNTIFMNPHLWSKKEKKYCIKYDKIICVVTEMKEKLVSNFAIDPKKMIVISNHEKKSFANHFKDNTNQECIDQKTFSITYVGGFGPHRGLDTAIEGMSKISKEIPNSKLYLVGKGSADVEKKLREITLQNKVKEYVEFIGYRPFKEVAAIMQASMVNIIPHKANAHTNNTIPHKLFQIMMSKSLLVVSSCKPLKRIVQKYNAGVLFEANNSEDFALKIIETYKNYDSLKNKIENAYDAVMQNENWETESIKLVHLYNTSN